MDMHTYTDADITIPFEDGHLLKNLFLEGNISMKVFPIELYLVLEGPKFGLEVSSILTGATDTMEGYLLLDNGHLETEGLAELIFTRLKSNLCHTDVAKLYTAFH